MLKHQKGQVISGRRIFRLYLQRLLIELLGFLPAALRLFQFGEQDVPAHIAGIVPDGFLVRRERLVRLATSRFELA